VTGKEVVAPAYIALLASSIVSKFKLVFVRRKKDA
jgi:hypothetical protein